MSYLLNPDGLVHAVYLAFRFCVFVLCDFAEMIKLCLCQYHLFYVLIKLTFV